MPVWNLQIDWKSIQKIFACVFIIWALISFDWQVKWLLLELHGRCWLPRVCPRTDLQTVLPSDASFGETAVRSAWETLDCAGKMWRVAGGHNIHGQRWTVLIYTVFDHDEKFKQDTCNSKENSILRKFTLRNEFSFNMSCKASLDFWGVVLVVWIESLCLFS